MRNRNTIAISLLLSVLITSIVYSIKTTNEDIPSEVLAEYTSHLETLQVRYDLTETLKSKKMVVTIQEADHDPEEIRELLWYKKAEDGGELLHIQALGAFNEPRGIAIANRNQFLLALIDEHEAYIGKLSDGILRKIFGVDLRVSDVLSAIFANPFLDGRTEPQNITGSRKKMVINRPGVEEKHTEKITLLVKNNKPRVTEWYINDNEGKLKQSVVFSDYREVDGILRPHKVEIERPLEKTRVVVRMQQVVLNIDIPDSRFAIEPFMTEDFEIIPLAELTETDEQESTETDEQE